MPEKDTPKVVRIEITPTPNEYRQLCDDLRELRKHGAKTNTAAIVEAVRAAALEGRISARKANGIGTRSRPNPHNRKVSS
ncbi:MAG: hypothetical protein ACTHN7_04215 [Solirubrobacterales bacterium]